MFNRYKFLTLGAAVLMTASAYSQITSAPGDRVIYGYSLGSSEFTETQEGYDTGFVAYPFNPAEEEGEFYGEMLDSYLDTPYIGVYAGTGVEGLLYVVEYEFSTSLTQPLATNLVCYNIFNGTKEIIGEWNPEQTDFKPQDMAYNEKDGNIYAVGYEGSQSGLYILDLSTAKFKKLYNLSRTAATLAIDGDGTFYALNAEGALFTINPQNGLTSTPLMYIDLGTMYSNQSMTFDKATGLLYWASVTFTFNPETGEDEGHDNCFLQEIDIKNKKVREVGQLGIGNRLVGLYLPSADNLLALNAPEIMVAPATDGSRKATLTFTAPTNTLNGTPLDGNATYGTIYGYQIYRNYGNSLNFKEEDVIYTNMSGTIEPGQVITWVDENIPSDGQYRYDVAFVNGTGLGAKGTYYQWIGPDAPGKVSNIKGTVINDMRGITLTWDAPTEGRHLGAYDPSTTKYTILRSPDNRKFENITETTFTDNASRLMKYQYDIIAINDAGESQDAFSNEYVLGPAQEIPFEQTFEDTNQVLNWWTPIDGNNDGYTWLFNTTLGQSAFGDAEACAEYVVSPGLGNSSVGSADDWLISPPLAFEAGKQYEFTMSSRSYTTDQVDVYMGDLNTGAAMTEKVGSFDIVVNPEKPELDPVTGTPKFYLRSLLIEPFEEDVIRCIGIHLVTKHESHNFFQINGIYVGDPGEFNGINDIDAIGEDVKIALNNKVISIFGGFRQAEVFDMNGRKVVSTSSAFIDMNNFASGVYVLVIDGRSFKLAL